MLFGKPSGTPLFLYIPINIMRLLLQERRWKMKNSEVRVCAIEYGVRLWELADQLGISPETLSRKLRRELVPEDKDRMIQAIRVIAAKR